MFMSCPNKHKMFDELLLEASVRFYPITRDVFIISNAMYPTHNCINKKGVCVKIFTLI